MISKYNNKISIDNFNLDLTALNFSFIGTVYCRYYISKEVLLIRIHPCFNRLELDFLLYFSDKNIENLSFCCLITTLSVSEQPNLRNLFLYGN